MKKRTYFSFDHSCGGSDGIPLIDGGIGANNPAALALAEGKGSESLKNWLAREAPEANSEDILIVSFGTGQMPPGINYERARRYSAKNWNGRLGNPLLEMLFVGYSRINDEICRTVVGEHNYFRFQPVLIQKNVDHLIRRNNVVLIDESESRSFAGATFSATPEVDTLFSRICKSYFYDNMIVTDPDSPDVQLRRLASRLI